MSGPLTPGHPTRDHRALKIGIAAGVLALFLAGCAQDNGSISGVTPEQARQMNGERSVFESSDDPPLTADTHFAAGQLAEANADPANAVKQYRQALKLDPAHKTATYRLAICLAQLKKYPDAVTVWKQYIDLTRGEATGYSNLGFCYELAGMVDRAEAAYRQGIDRDPRNVACRTNYGLMLARLGRTAEATLQLQAVLSDAEVHYNLGSVLEQQGRKQAARAEYQKALQLAPEFKDAQSRLAALE